MSQLEEIKNQKFSSNHLQQSESSLGIESIELPKTVVMKLAKSTGPENMKLAKEVPIALARSSTIFINYLASIAEDIASSNSQKILNAQHVLEACEELNWSDGNELQKVLKTELKAFRKLNKVKKLEKVGRLNNQNNKPSGSSTAMAQDDISKVQSNRGPDVTDEILVDDLQPRFGKANHQNSDPQGDNKEDEDEAEDDEAEEFEEEFEEEAGEEVEDEIQEEQEDENLENVEMDEDLDKENE
ncbi:hypothetical protein O181_005500 [Austropuccinia psidii MF-1]|uniref:DNA polymerase epsilon subunit D n=1 Tax=Austropuccinia psidii MF-1 TaxID=1389203 RepID=A0A9Q3BIH8_9BASI|nr:hypothetical protein [Austropuccinia psidii MF-1]